MQFCTSVLFIDVIGAAYYYPLLMRFTVSYCQGWWVVVMDNMNGVIM